jgi:methylenetetrahydrofolate--tRNA-(uracil-5-)-methyltransferase
MTIQIIGAGLAGVEAAHYLLKKGYEVVLYEMRPKKMTPAHQTGHFAELVCSNSLRSNDPYNAVGLLKEEMRMLDSIVLKAATVAEVPAGSSLAVDRILFSTTIESVLKSYPTLTIKEEEKTILDPNIPTIIATGPLTTEALMHEIGKLQGEHTLHFFDAVAPIIDYESIDMNVCYKKSRYDKGDADYINCPMDQQQYLAFYEQLTQSDVVEIKDFENNVFEGCMPVETMASRGIDTLRYGPLKPVGLEQEGKERPYAVIQLRQDDVRGSMYNIVGFQTHLTWPAQKKLIQSIPGLEHANIIRYGVMHKNHYLESHLILNASYQMKQYPNLFIAGQLSGVEGYVESAAAGLNAAVQLDLFLQRRHVKPFPETSMIGAMSHYISSPNKSFVPMNANFGLLPSPTHKMKKDMRKKWYHDEAIRTFQQYLNEVLNG